VGELNDWIHFDAIRLLVHHATAVIAAIFLFGVTGRLIAYLIPNGHAKKVVLMVDDVILLAVFVLTGWRLLSYMWFRPHLEDLTDQAPRVIAPVEDRTGDLIEKLLERCRKESPAADRLDQCLQEEDSRAKQAMAGAAGRMMDEMRALDKVGSAKIGALRSFEAAQSAFVLYRQAECQWRSIAATNGAGNNIYRACMASLAQVRAAHIQEMLHR